MCLGILSKWEGEPGSSSISRLTSEAKNLLANCEIELEARDEGLCCFYISYNSHGYKAIPEMYAQFTLAITVRLSNASSNSIECDSRRRVEREAMERMALMVELEGWVREAQDRLDAELGAVTTVGREQRSYLKKAS